jgi:hypothetical protein
MSSVPPPIDPYQPPQAPSEPRLAISDSRAATDISGPATGLLITAIVGGAIQVLGLFINMLGAGLGSITATGSEEQIINWISGGFGVASAAVGLLIAGLIIYASMEMKKLRQWGLAMAASILAMVPCISPCCILGLPMGIWSLVILMRDDVKAAFR